MPSLKRNGSHLLRNGSHLINECGSITTDCCAETIPVSLTATFGGCLAALGSVTLTYNSGTTYWEGSSSACGGDVFIQFLCYDPGTGYVFDMDVVGGDLTATSFVEDSLVCDPFDWDATDTAVSGGSCPGTGTVSITA